MAAEEQRRAVAVGLAVELLTGHAVPPALGRPRLNVEVTIDNTTDPVEGLRMLLTYVVLLWGGGTWCALNIVFLFRRCCRQCLRG